MDFLVTFIMHLSKAFDIVYVLIFTKLQYYQTVKDSLTLLLVIVNNRLPETQKLLRKILRNLRGIFYVRHVVFNHCTTLDERYFFFKIFFFLVS